MIDTKQFEGHTPGPWKVNDRWAEQIVTNPFREQVKGDNGINIAKVYWGTDGHEANAALIAAAPELLAVHDDLVAALEHEIARNHDHDPDKCSGCELAKAALARARGTTT